MLQNLHLSFCDSFWFEKQICRSFVMFCDFTTDSTFCFNGFTLLGRGIDILFISLIV